MFVFFFFFNDTATTEIYTLSLHDALPILAVALQFESIAPLARDVGQEAMPEHAAVGLQLGDGIAIQPDRKSTRLNSSHLVISYAVFCLKKKKKKTIASRRGSIDHEPRRAT